MIPEARQGSLPADEVAALLQEIERGAEWQTAVANSELPGLAAKRDWFSNPAKAAFYLSLAVPSRKLALDVGAGSGVIAAELGRHFERAIALEQDARWCQFMRHRFDQDRLDVDVIHGNALRLPASVANVDLVAVNGVLEWVASGDAPEARSGSPRDVQLGFLRSIRSALRPGGRIGIAIENRFHYEFFRGSAPHNDLPYCTVMPRPLANYVTRRRLGKPYRTWIYSARGYRHLLRDAGFVNVEISGALPNYHRPEQTVPLDRFDVIRSYMNGGSPVRRLAIQALATSGLLGQTVHSFYIAAERP